MRKNAIVMGASSGMGREVALLLLADGWQVGVAARRADALEQLRKQYYMAKHGGGHIAAITSVAGTKGLGMAPSYSATKAFQNTYLQALEQLANIRKLNISFTDIRPGFVATALLDDEHHYPMLMNVQTTARLIMKAVKAKKHMAIVDWRYRVLIALWRRVPKCIWRHLPIKTKD